ncbi:spoVR like protein domain-containing protein [Purpureocillium lavendulum]|uniref:SpoVR like protein domain-containing protein n=1 Tax=Purpureocillium lavendulum TaxID=1247861 RepID=A0AB34FH30_9HYPO|nr:spoVR like protein domain-containing protein [Purpureocillium lavendulum]
MRRPLQVGSGPEPDQESNTVDVPFPSKLLRFVQPPSPTVRICIDNYYPGKVYTTGDRITGTISVQTTSNIPYRHLSVSLDGFASTDVSAARSYGTGVARHQFLHLPVGPHDVSGLPLPGWYFYFVAGETYRIPFELTIPERRLSRNPACVCQQSWTGPSDRHRRLHPTMGRWSRKDMSTTGARIDYFVSVKAAILPGDDESKYRQFKESHYIHIMPASPEEPALVIPKASTKFTTFASKTLRPAWYRISKRTGQLDVATCQPPAIMVNSEGRDVTGSRVKLDFVFEPEEPGTPLPVIDMVRGSIVASTAYSDQSMINLDKASVGIVTGGFPLEYHKEIKIFWEQPAQPTWSRQTCQRCQEAMPPSNNPLIRTALDTAITESAIMPLAAGRSTRNADPSELLAHNCRRPLLHAQLDIKFGLHKQCKYMFLPTFYLCTVSRTYSIRLKLWVVSGQHRQVLRLVVPIQIGMPQRNHTMTEGRIDVNKVGPMTPLPLAPHLLGTRKVAVVGEDTVPLTSHDPEEDLQRVGQDAVAGETTAAPKSQSLPKAIWDDPDIMPLRQKATAPSASHDPVLPTSDGSENEQLQESLDIGDSAQIAVDFLT